MWQTGPIFHTQNAMSWENYLLTVCVLLLWAQSPYLLATPLPADEIVSLLHLTALEVRRPSLSPWPEPWGWVCQESLLRRGQRSLGHQTPSLWLAGLHSQCGQNGLPRLLLFHHCCFLVKLSIERVNLMVSAVIADGLARHIIHLPSAPWSMSHCRHWVCPLPAADECVYVYIVWERKEVNERI